MYYQLAFNSYLLNAEYTYWHTFLVYLRVLHSSGFAQIVLYLSIVQENISSEILEGENISKSEKPSHNLVLIRVRCSLALFCQLVNPQ